MDLTPYVDRMRHELIAVTDASAPEVRAAAERVAAALDPVARMTMLELLSQAAAEITTLVPSGSVDVRLRGREAEFVVDVPPPPPQFSTPGPEDAGQASDLPEGETDTDVVRITVRMPESVKVRAEELAAKSGRSLNAWIVTALRAATRERTGPHIEFDIDLGRFGRATDPSRATDPGRATGRQLSGWL